MVKRVKSKKLTKILICGFFPKRSDLTNFNDQEIIAVVTDVNSRHTRSLGRKSPSEVFFVKTLYLC